jgi:hypothetical protein
MASEQPRRFPVPSGATVKVSVIDTTSCISKGDVPIFMGPVMPGFSILPDLPAWSFLIESESSGQKALFDLGIPPDWENFAPVTVERIKHFGWGIHAEKHVADILEENGVKRDSVGSIIWR